MNYRYTHELPTQLLFLRKEAGKSQRQLAAETGIVFNRLRNAENGELLGGFRADEIERLAKVLGVTVKALL